METSSRDIISSRVLPYPRERVFRAIAEAERIARWWGPAGFRTSIDRFEFRPGGQWVFTMHGPDGQDHANRCVFEQIEAPGRVVLRHDCAPFFTMHMTLSDERGGTRLHWCQRFDDAQVRAALAEICIPANEQNFDRLQAELAAHP